MAAGKDLSDDTQIRVIGRMEPEICTKMLKKLREKLGAKFPATTPGCSMFKIPRLDDAFLEARPAEGQSLQKKKKERRKRKGGKKFQKSKSLKT